MLFKSKTILSIAVRTASGSVHVRFDPVTTGGSMYRTYNEELIEGLKKHHKYGKTFMEVEERQPEPVKPVEVPEVEEVKVITVDSAEDAKEYLADRFGVPRTQIRSIVKIKEFASKYNIQFEGI